MEIKERKKRRKGEKIEKAWNRKAGRTGAWKKYSRGAEVENEIRKKRCRISFLFRGRKRGVFAERRKRVKGEGGAREGLETENSNDETSIALQSLQQTAHARASDSFSEVVHFLLFPFPTPPVVKCRSGAYPLPMETGVPCLVPLYAAVRLSLCLI